MAAAPSASQPPFVAAARAELATELGAPEEAWLSQPENLRPTRARTTAASSAPTLTATQ